MYIARFRLSVHVYIVEMYTVTAALRISDRGFPDPRHRALIRQVRQSFDAHEFFEWKIR